MNFSSYKWLIQVLIRVLIQVQKVCSPKKAMKQTHSDLFNKKSEFQRHLDRYEVPITWHLDRNEIPITRHLDHHEIPQVIPNGT